jgi:flagellin
MSISVQPNTAPLAPLSNAPPGLQNPAAANRDADGGTSSSASPAVSVDKQLSAHRDIVAMLSNSQQGGVGPLVDSDLAVESARLQALQVQQQLGGQPLSIANQAPQQILQLFKS